MYYENTNLSEPVKDFNSMNSNQLSELVQRNEFSFSIDQLIFIQGYFKNEKKSLPTYEQLFFFDTLNKIKISKKEDLAIFSATAEEGTDSIMQASRDLLTKRSLCKLKTYGAMPVSVAANIASEYLKYVGYGENDKAFISAFGKKNLGYYIHTDDDIPLFTFASGEQTADTEEETPLPYENAFVMLCPACDMDYSEYKERVLTFSDIPEVSSVIAEFNAIEEDYGIYGILSKEKRGIFVNLAGIPEVEKDENGRVLKLSTLISSCIGRYVFTTHNTSVGLLNRIANEHSLLAFVFAARNVSGSFTLETIKNPDFSFNLDFLRRISQFKAHCEYRFSQEIDQPLGKRQNVFLTDGRSPIRQTYRAEKTLDFGSTIACATSRKLSSTPHKSAAISVLDAVTSLVTKGVAKNAISLRISYTLLGNTDDSIELGKNLSAVLGAYRSMIELCVSDYSPIIMYNKSKRDITVLASAKPPIKRIKSEFFCKSTKVYFIPYTYIEDGMPNYADYRTKLYDFYAMLDKNYVKSTFAVNENLSTIIKNIPTEYTFELDTAVNTNDQVLSHGILFEVDENTRLDFEPMYIGKIKENI